MEQSIIDFAQTGKKEHVILFLNIVRNYYYNNDAPSSDDELKLLKRQFKISNTDDIETFLSSISDPLWDKIVDISETKHKINKNTGSTPLHKKTILPVFVGSLDKVKNENDYLSWYQQNKKNKEDMSSIIVTEKLDGISSLLCLTTDVENGKDNVKLYTRGNGKIGSDISHILPYLGLDEKIKNVRTLFSLFNMNYPKTFCVRGELIMKKNGEDNLRNIVSGLVHKKELSSDVIEKLKQVDFVAYRIYDRSYKYTYVLQSFVKYGFKIPQCCYFNEKPTYSELVETLNKFNINSMYTIDGLVVSVDYVHQRDPEDKNPVHSIAIKNTGESKNTRVIEVEWNVSKHGIYKPRIRIEPVIINGANIEWVTGFNAKYILDNRIGKDTIVEVERSGDVIPNIKNVVKPTKADMPSDNWKWNKTGVDVTIEEEENTEMEIKKLYTFFKEFECPHLGPKTVETLYECGYKTVSQILDLTKKDLLETEKFKDKSATNVLEGINTAITEISNPNKTHILMYASGCFGFGLGSKKIKIILEKMPEIVNVFSDINRDQLVKQVKEVKGISEQAETFVDNIEKYKKFLKTINKYVSTNTNTMKKETKKEKSEIIVFTGFRDKNLKKKLEENGYIVNDNITKETSILIYEETDSSKYKKAKDMGIKLINKSDTEIELSL